MRATRKIIPYEELIAWRAGLSAQNAPLVATNGCFDLLHPGHRFLLEQARSLGKTLIVGLTGDDAVRQLKGPGRPVVEESNRVRALANLEAVTYVCLFPELDAVAFLEKCRPDIYVKGGDYTLETINQIERQSLVRLGCRIEILPKFENYSTTALLQSKGFGSGNNVAPISCAESGASQKNLRRL